ncbi:hypothetical protein RJT34_23093 [Clitoria ternatea]|uniref:Uncharacterized protein n=1 Tax=Clitoria ternatea TaxID=43366 RepID=A0AAN9FRG0_CLITE
MATDSAASDHASTSHEQYVKQEKDEAIAQKIASLANEDEDKPKDAQDQATPSSKTEEDEVKAELTAVEVKKPVDSPALENSAEDTLKHDKVEDVTEPREGDDQKVEPVVSVEKTEEPVPMDASVAVADNVKEEKEPVAESQNISETEPLHEAAKCQPDEAPSTESTVKETPQEEEKEPIGTVEEKPAKTEDIPEVSAGTSEESSKTDEANPPLTESEKEVVKEAELLEPSYQEEKKPEPEAVATQEQEKTKEPEKESQKAEQPSTAEVPELPAETVEKPSDTIEKETTEPSAEVLKETSNYEVEPTDIVKAEPVVTEVEENKKEPENQSLEQREEEQPDASAVIPTQSEETIDAIEEKTRELELEAEVSKETNNIEAGPTETVKAESVATKVDESQSEPERQSFKQEEEKQPKTVAPGTAAESAEQPSNIVEDSPPKDSDIEVVKETEKSEALPAKEEKPEPLSTEVEEKPQVGEEVEETSKDAETKQEIVLDTAKSEGTSEDTIKEPILSSKEKEETSLTVNAAQVSPNGIAEVAPANVVEPSPEVAEKVVEEDGKKESSLNDAIEGVSNEVVGVIKNPEQTSTDQEVKTSLNDEKEDSVPTGVEETVALAANDDKKEAEAPDAVTESSRGVEFENKKVEEQNEGKTATTEAESVENDSSAVNNKKEENTDTKVDEISRAVSEPVTVRETLASKFEEKEEKSVETGGDNLEKEQVVEPEKTEVQATKESDVTKPSKDLPKETPAKPAQKQSNNIISKVKQSLVKAKKAITGKSPSSKNLSSEAKGDIKVK